MSLDYTFHLTGRSSLWACCTAPPPPKPKKEKKVKKEKEKKPKKEKKSKKDNKPDEGHSLPVGFQCNGGDEVNPVAIRDRGTAGGDNADWHPPEGKQQSHLPYCVDKKTKPENF